MKTKKLIISGLVVLGLLGTTVIGYRISYNLLPKNDLRNLSESSNQETEETIGSKNVITITASSDYVYTQPQDLYNYSDLVIEGTYMKDIQTLMFNNEPRPKTISKFTVQNVLKNTNSYEIGSEIEVVYSGGTISLREYMSKQPQNMLEKSDFTKMSQQEIDNTMVEYVIDTYADKELTTSKNRILFLKYNNILNRYTVVGDYFGMLKYNKEQKKVLNNTTKQYQSYSFFK